MFLATAMSLGSGVWRVMVTGYRCMKLRDVTGGALVVDVARAMGATHIVWRDVYGPDGLTRPNAFREPMPLA